MIMPRNRLPGARNRARAARKTPSVAEDIAWTFLRNQKLGFRFKREHPLLNYRLDFYCHEALLAVEFDGEQHDAAKDTKRDEELAALGIAVFRIPNRSFFQVDVHEQPQDWLRSLQMECEKRSGRKAFAD